MTWDIIGHTRAVRTLRHAVAVDEPAHAYLLTGPARIGKRTLARELAAALNCTAEPDKRPCHQCPSCRMIGHEAHPDFIVVEREGDRRLRVEEIREARGSADWRPYQGRYKVYVFVDADELTEGAANALLKTLEEPPPQVVLALTASGAEAVPPTVLSRCRVVPVQPVPLHELATGLQERHGTTPEEAQRIAGLAGGRAGWAVEALSNPALVVQRAADVDRAVALSRRHPEGRLSERLVMAGEVCKGETFLESRARCLRALDDMQVWWRDLLVVASGAATPLVHDDRRDELARQAERRGSAEIMRGLREIEVTADAVERNVTPRLALEALLLRLN
jgi:DNA polymerase-3 subunit delta'